MREAGPCGGMAGRGGDAEIEEHSERCSMSSSDESLLLPRLSVLSFGKCDRFSILSTMLLVSCDVPGVSHCAVAVLACTVSQAAAVVRSSLHASPA